MLRVVAIVLALAAGFDHYMLNVFRHGIRTPFSG
jgi:hypothetical protein